MRRARYKVRLRDHRDLDAVEVDYLHGGRWLLARTLRSRIVDDGESDPRQVLDVVTRTIPASNIREVEDLEAGA